MSKITLWGKGEKKRQCQNRRCRKWEKWLGLNRFYFQVLCIRYGQGCGKQTGIVRFGNSGYCLEGQL